MHKSKRLKYTSALAFCIILALTLLTGCHEKYDLAQLAEEYAQESGDAYIDTAETENESSEGEGTEEDDASNPEGSSSVNNQGNSDLETEEDGSGAPPSSILGNTTTSNYSNSFFGIKFTRPSNDWYIATDDELGQVMGIATSSISDEKILETLQKSGFVMDFYALDTSGNADSLTFDNVNITIEDIGKMYGVLLTEQELAEASIASSKSALESQGWKNVSIEVDEAVFAGSPRVCTSSSAEMDGTKMFQKQIYIKKESYIACVTVGSFGSDKTEQMLKAFTSL